MLNVGDWRVTGEVAKKRKSDMTDGLEVSRRGVCRGGWLMVTP
jgi:hypothetical protein